MKIVRLTTSLLFIAVVAGTWDIWWHGAIGRDTFWEPPHLLLYSSVALAIATGLYGWYKTRERVWKRLAVVLTLVPLSAPFDELWHRIFGIEDPSSVLIVWSPPHITITVMITAAFILLLPLIRRDTVIAQRLFGGLAFGGILSLLLFLVTPLQPTGPYELLGFWGAGIIAAVFTTVLLMAQRWIPDIAAATLVIALFTLLTSVGFGENLSPGIATTVPPHDHSPAWLIIFANITPAVVIDLLRNKSLLLKGALIGILWAGILYGFSLYFFEPTFQYPFSEATKAIFASALGGLAAGLLVSLYRKKNTNTS